ncbi:MAG: DUF4337 domain-containing protein [Candidatus Eremiobacteraeota bacterium]|nr:DUF4337 domain-containing protein [Candidatus Eremiobacteraeota bacterium]
MERARESIAGDRHNALRFIPLLAAVLAIFAGLSSLYASRLGEEGLSSKNEAVLAQARASDMWAEYQAESIKAHLYEIAVIANVSTPTGRSRLRALEAQYRRRQPALLSSAKMAEEDRDAALRFSQRIESRKVKFDIAVALYEVAIVLASIAAIVRRWALFGLSAAGGVVGLAFTILGVAG